MSRFPKGSGTLLDLEFLQDESGRRVAAFGYHAGFAGAALGLEAWAWQHSHPEEELGGVEPYPNEDSLIKHVTEAVSESGMVQFGYVLGSDTDKIKAKKIGRNPRVLVVGALGRCGKGAVDLALKVGIPSENVLQWDMAETAKGGPFAEIIECEYLPILYRDNMS